MITLQNNGLLELDLIKTMGVNVKEGDSIGFFGTGLKYAIAVLLREDVKFSLFIGENEFIFHTEVKRIRGKDFNLCYMTGPSDSIQLAFTTELGKTWKVWQAYRELHSNCLDENGVISKEHLPPTSETTTFYIEDLDFTGVFLEPEKTKLFYENEDIQIFEGESSLLYYNGIRAKDIRKSKYTYNLTKPCTLTEDRLICYDSEIKECINKAVVEMAEHSPEIMAGIISCEDGWFEAELSMGNNTEVKPTETFIKEVKKLGTSKVNHGVSSYIQRHEPPKKLTWDEKRYNFIEEIEELCRDYKVCVIEDHESINLTEGILGDDPSEEIG